MENWQPSEAVLQQIAKQAAPIAADLVWQFVYIEVGKTAFRLFLYVAGALVLVGLAWLGIHEKIGA